MRPKISASKAILTRVIEKINIALINGKQIIATKGRVILMVVDGYKYCDIASIFQLSTDTVGRYVAEFLHRGVKALESKKKKGRPAKLCKEQSKALKALLTKGPEHSGFPGSAWQGPMIQELIQREFGVFYAATYIARIMDKLGFSWQKGSFDLTGKDEKSRRLWWAKTWPQIKQLAEETRAKILFEDESSFSINGSLGYGWALKGKQPKVNSLGLRKNIKVFGSIELTSGRIFSMLTDGPLNSSAYIGFMKSVLSETTSKIIWIHDGAGYHTSREVNSFIESRKHRLSVYRLPAYSPDYNPIEGLWKKIKRYGTHMKYFPDVEDLQIKLIEMLNYFKDRPDEVRSLMLKYQES